MSLEIFARQSLSQFIIIYSEIFDNKVIQPADLDTIMWARMCAKEAGITKTSFKIPFDNIKRAKVTLPYMPDNITYTGCCAIKKNGGLFTPCCGKTPEGSSFCKTCSVDKEGNAKEIEFGVIEERETSIEEGRFAPITFGEWMKAHKTTLTEVYAKLAAAGIAIEIEPDQLVCRVLPKSRRGRPSKSDEEPSDEDSVPKAKAAKVKAPKVVKAESESESEAEAPKPKPKPSPKPSPKASPASSPATSEDEAPKKKEKKEKAAKEPKKEKAAKEPKKAAKEPKKEKADKEPKKEKADKEPKEKKAAKKKEKSELEAAIEASDKLEQIGEMIEDMDEDCEGEEEDCEVDGVKYTLRNSKFVCDKDSGAILGIIDDEGEVEWKSEAR
jgi:hypothetical protein